MARRAASRMQCADSSFAWRDCSPLRLQFGLISAVSPTCRFLRRMRASIVSSDSLSAADVPRLLSFASSCCVVLLGFSAWGNIDSDVARQLLTDPSMQSLQDVGPVAEESLVELIAALSQLTSFCLAPPCPGMDNGFDPDASLPCRTSARCSSRIRGGRLTAASPR